MQYFNLTIISKAILLISTTILLSMPKSTLAENVDKYGSKEAIRIAENMLLYQHPNGGWEKNYDEKERLSKDDIKELEKKRDRIRSTIDNGATHKEVKYLAQVFQATKDKRFSQASLAGIHFMLDAQYDNGGWPQFYPPGSGYYKHITYNDGAMIGVMTALRDIYQDKPEYSFVDKKIKAQAKEAVEKGVKCILKTQITVHGKKTVWCAQHDKDTLAPAKARSYELASLSGGESVGIVRFLMAMEKPSPEVIASIEAAVSWYKEAQIEGIRVEKVKGDQYENGYDRVIIKDPKAPPLWARFYEIGTNKPIYCSRDGIPRPSLADISHERRNGYSWIGNYGANLLNRDYPAWRKKIAGQK